MNPLQDVLDGPLRSIWVAACQDAGFDAESVTCPILLYPFPGLFSPDNCRAKSWPTLVDVEPQEIPSGCEIPKNLSVHRVAVWTGGTTEGTAGLLRHELEHIRQIVHHRQHGGGEYELFDLHVDARNSVASCGGKYQTIPMESDANAAAAIFVRRLYGDERIDYLTDSEDIDSFVFSPREGPQSMDGLPQRMKTFEADLKLSHTA